jgi:hypothetical protein
MFQAARILALLFALLLSAGAQQDHVIVTGGPTLRKWENLRVPKDQHDRWWANFIRASTLRMAEIRKAYGPQAKIVWLVHQPSYQARGHEDGKPYTTWITELAASRQISLIWFSDSATFIKSLNARPRKSIITLDYFGHSNRYAFMFDYGNEIMAASTSLLHQRDLSRIKSSIFDKNAHCKSWGCHTGQSMSAVWKSSVGIPLEGARGPTSYVDVGQGTMPVVHGSWTR